MKTEQDAMKKIKKIVSENDAAMLVTHNSDGQLVSRPMTTQEQEFDGDVWFFVSQNSEVVKEVEANSKVNVAYAQDGKFVSLTGIGSIVNDISKKKELWYPELKHWFDGKGPEAPEVTLIKVDTESARYWDSPNGLIGTAITIVKSMFSDKDESPIESGTVNY